MFSCTDVDVSYRDIANDVVVQPNTGGKVILANVAWRSGAAYNGFYLSTDGGGTWAKINPNGAINPKDIGNATPAVLRRRLSALRRARVAAGS